MKTDIYHPSSKPFDPKLEADILFVFSHFLTENGATSEWLYNYLDHPDFLEILIFRKANGAAVGLYIIHCYEAVGNLVYMKGGVGLVPGYRDRIPRFRVLWRLILARLRYWRKKMYVFTHLMNPVSYASYGKFLHTFYPNPSGEHPHSLLKAVEAAKIYFKEPDDIVQQDTTIQLSQKELERIHSSKNPYILHYLKLNPDFRKNLAIFTLVPFNLKGTFYTLFKVIRHHFFAKKNKPTSH